MNSSTIVSRIYLTNSNGLRRLFQLQKISLTGIDNDIYSTIDACPNVCEIWKVIERGKAIVNSPPPTYDQESKMVVEDDALLKENDIDKLMALISLLFKKNKPTDNNFRTSSNTSRANQDNTLRINEGIDEQGDTNIPTDSLDMSNNGGEADHDEYDDLARERDLLASLIDKLKYEIDENKNHNKPLELSNKTLVDKLYHDVSYTSKVEIDCAKAKDSLAKKDFSKSKSVDINNVSKYFSKPVTTQILPQNVKSILKNTNVIAPRMYKVHTKPNQTRTPQLPQEIRKTNKRVSFSTGVIPTTSVSRPQLKSNQLEDRVMHNNSEGRKQQVRIPP
nr:hypothetical protein [Tanacetum cinerariifolium]